MRSVIFGGGELGSAVALSLRANGKRAALRLRDQNTLQAMTSTRMFSAFRPMHELPLAAAGYGTQADSALTLSLLTEALDAPANAWFVCTPASALRTPEEEQASSVSSSPPAGAPVATSLTSAFVALSQQNLELQKRVSCDSAALQGAATSVASPLPTAPIVLFSRGLMRDGSSPAHRLRDALKNCDTACDVIVASAAAIPREWARHSVELLQGSAAESSGALPSVAALGAAASPNASLHSASVIEKLFTRESVYWMPSLCSAGGEGDVDAADVLSVINAASLLVAFGAGMVSNEYPGSLSASIAYCAHAVSATEALVRGLTSVSQPDECAVTSFLARNKKPQGPGPSCAPLLTSVMMSAVAHQGSKEFALGRRLRAACRQRDLVRSVYGNRSSDGLAALDDTVCGLEVRMKSAKHTNGFFDNIIDAYATIKRAEDVGKQLVKLGQYGDELTAMRDAHPNSLASCVARMDAAIESEEGYDSASRHFVEAFSDLSAASAEKRV